MKYRFWRFWEVVLLGTFGDPGEMRGAAWTQLPGGWGVKLGRWCRERRYEAQIEQTFQRVKEVKEK